MTTVSGPKNFTFFGNFGLGNLGNDSTLQAILYHLRRLLPDAEVSCICSGPSATATIYNVAAVDINRTFLPTWKPQTKIMRAVRAIAIGIPSEPCRWLHGLIALKRTDVLIIPGTGLLTDAYGVRTGWGPYSLFRWSLLAKIRGCKVLFVSVGAGPIYTKRGKWLVRSALRLADFRSYRDSETKQYLTSIGAAGPTDRVYPDLVFSIAEEIKPPPPHTQSSRPVVGLGLLLYHDKLSSETPEGSTRTVASYLQQLISFARWLLAKDYDIRLLTGDLCDRPVVTHFKTLLYAASDNIAIDRIIDQPLLSVDDLITALAGTQFVVATRFHNVLWALALNKPVISISFHPKCASLMQSMGLHDYCRDIKHLSADDLIQQFSQLEKNAENLKNAIRNKVLECRKALDEQYGTIFSDVCFDRRSILSPATLGS